MKDYNFLKSVKLFVLDMDGTVYIDDTLLNGAKDFIDYMRTENKDFVFFTNNSSKSVNLYREKLYRLGIEVKKNEILSSTEVMTEYLHKNHEGKRVFALGNKSFLASLKDSGISLINEEADLDTIPDIVLVAFDTELDYKKLNLACHYIRKGAGFLATHPDINCPCEYGYMIDCGAICEAITASTKVRPVYTGKPSRLTLEMIAGMKGYSYNEICFIGDRLYTDIACAVHHGAYGVLVLSGETDGKMLEESEVRPTAVFDDLMDLYKTCIKQDK